MVYVEGFMISIDIRKKEVSNSEICQWCFDTFGKGGYSYTYIPGYRWTIYPYSSGGLRINFENEEDYTWFILRWGSE